MRRMGHGCSFFRIKLVTLEIGETWKKMAFGLRFMEQLSMLLGNTIKLKYFLRPREYNLILCNEWTVATRFAIQLRIQ